MQRKTFRYIVLLFAIIASVNSNGQTWYWTRQADSSAGTGLYPGQTSSQVAVDRNNNPVYTGYFEGSRMSFGSFGLDNFGIQSDFLAKYSPTGTPLWARNATALSPSAYVYGMSVATERDNAILEGGYYTDSIAFGAYHLNAKTSGGNTFLTKYDANGNLLWATGATFATNVYYNENFSVIADKQNNIYITGYFLDTIIFGHDTLKAGGYSMYLVKYNSLGHVIWAKVPVMSPGGLTYGLSVATDDSGNAYVAGNVSDSATFGPGVKIGNNGNTTVYIAKYDSSGHAKWAINTTATPGQTLPTPVVVDKSNHVYLGAQFTNLSITYGAYTVTNSSTDGASNAMLIKYDRDGNVLWATCADYISQAEVNTIIESSVAVDRCENVYWSGLCSDSFGVGKVKVTVSGGWSHPSRVFAYVIKLDSSANPIAGAAMANSNANSFSNYLAVDSLSKALFASELLAPPQLVIGSDTVNRYLTYPTCFLSKFAVIPSIITGNNNTDSICYGDSAILGIVPVTGTTYKWSNGATTDTIVVKPAVTTTYSVTANNGCMIDTSYVKVTVGPKIIPNVKANPDTICKGSTAKLIAGGGTTYKWSTGATTDSIIVSPTRDSTFTLTAYNGGCSRDTTFTVYVLSTPTAVIAALPDTICPGDSALLTASGGTKYSWSTGKTTTSIWVKPGITTTYTLQAFSGKCSDSAVIKVSILPATTATVSPNDTICPGGSAILSATGSGGNITYKWNTGETTSSISVSPSVNTTYTVNVYGKCDTVKKNISVIMDPIPVAVIKGTPSKCKGVKDTLMASGGATYLWSNGATGTTYYTGVIDGDSIITLIAYNALGCSDTTQFKITVTTETASVNGGTVCSGNCTTLVVTASGSGLTYSWNNGATTDSVTVCPDTATTYTVFVNDNGCITKKTALVQIYTPSMYACCDTIIASGESTRLKAISTTNYKWAPPTSLNCDTCSTVVATPTVTTTYSVTGTDSHGCPDTRLITVIVDEPCFSFNVPNVITPDYPGPNGVNNVFYIKTENITGWSIYIYDRWGKEMFKTTNQNVYWAGDTEGGAKAPDGIYYYIISGTCNNNTYKKEGFLQLIR